MSGCVCLVTRGHRGQDRGFSMDQNWFLSHPRSRGRSTAPWQPQDCALGGMGAPHKASDFWLMVLPIPRTCRSQGPHSPCLLGSSQGTSHIHVCVSCSFQSPSFVRRGNISVWLADTSQAQQMLVKFINNMINNQVSNKVWMRTVRVRRGVMSYI